MLCIAPSNQFCEEVSMYVMPVMLLPYVMFSAWLDFWCGQVQAKRHIRDPLADAGGGSTSVAALTAGTGRELVGLADVTR